MGELNITDAYLAGIVDGEGWIGIARTKGNGTYFDYFRLTVQVNMTDPVAVKALHLRFGGVFKEKPPRKHCHKIQYVWAVVCRDAEKCVKVLLPYLRVKKRQAEAGLRLREVQRVRQERVRAYRMTLAQEERDIVADISKLNKRGV